MSDLTLDHPTVRAFLSRRGEAPDATAAALCDWLQDEGADLANLCWLYAGTPPEHLDGIPGAVLALWLECHGDREGAAAVRRGRVEVRAASPRTYHVRLCRPATGEWEVFCVGGGDDVPARRWQERARAEADARRELKRRVLSLPAFAEVRVTRRADLPFAVAAEMTPGSRDWHDVLAAAHLRRDLPYESVPDYTRHCWVLTQTLTAPQLVWPEPGPTAGLPSVPWDAPAQPTPAADFAALEEWLAETDRRIVAGLGLPASPPQEDSPGR